MRIFIISDHAPTSQRVRQALLGQGQDCPADHILPMHGATERLAQTPADLLVIVLPPDPNRSLGLLTDLRLLSPARMLVVGPALDSRLVLLALRAGGVARAGMGRPLRALPGRLGRCAAVAGAGTAARWPLPTTPDTARPRQR